MGVKHGPQQSSSALASMHLTCGHYTRPWGYHILAMWRMWKSEQPPDIILSPIWSPGRRLRLSGHIAPSSP